MREMHLRAHTCKDAPMRNTSACTHLPREMIHHRNRDAWRPVEDFNFYDIYFVFTLMSMTKPPRYPWSALLFRPCPRDQPRLLTLPVPYFPLLLLILFLLPLSFLHPLPPRRPPPPFPSVLLNLQ